MTCSSYQSSTRSSCWISVQVRQSTSIQYFSDHVTCVSDTDRSCIVLVEPLILKLISLNVGINPAQFLIWNVLGYRNLGILNDNGSLFR